jgi:hypothetical protein
MNIEKTASIIMASAYRRKRNGGEIGGSEISNGVMAKAIMKMA